MDYRESFIKTELSTLELNSHWALSLEEIESEFSKRKNTRLSDKTVLKIVSHVNLWGHHPSINDYGLIYDLLHYFLFSTPHKSATIPMTYVQNHWSACNKDYIPRLNWLKKIGVLTEGGAFSPISVGRSLNGAQRTLTLSDVWHQEIQESKMFPTNIVRPYGFQPHFKSILDDLSEAEKKEIFKHTRLSQRSINKLKGLEPLNESRQPWYCGFSNLIPDYHRAVQVAKRKVVPARIAFNPMAKTHWLSQLNFYPDKRLVDEAIRGKCTNRDTMQIHNDLVRWQALSWPGEINPDDPSAPNAETYVYAGKDMDGEDRYAQIRLKIRVGPPTYGEVSEGQLRVMRRLEATRNGP